MENIQSGKRTEIHVLPVVGHGGSGIEISKERDGDAIRLAARWEGETYVEEGHERFEDVLDALLKKLPQGVTPIMCGACRLGLLDPFGSSNGYDDLSCFRHRKDLAREYHEKYRQASREVWEHMYRVRVSAFEGCLEFEPR